MFVGTSLALNSYIVKMALLLNMSMDVKSGGSIVFITEKMGLLLNIPVVTNHIGFMGNVIEKMTPQLNGLVAIKSGGSTMKNSLKQFYKHLLSKTETISEMTELLKLIESNINNSGL